MKKLLMFLCCVFMMNGAWAAGDCPASFIQFHGTQGPNDDEFLYSTVKAQNSAVDGFKTSKSFNLTGGKVFECDNQQGCMNGTRVYVGANDNYAFEGDRVNNLIFECSVGFADKWIKHSYTECPDDRINETYRVKFVNTNDADCLPVGPYNYCCFTGEHRSCLEAQKRGEPANWTQSKTCNCGDKHVWNSKTGHCEKKPDNGGGNSSSCKNIQEKKACLVEGEKGIADWNEKTCSCKCKPGKGTWNKQKFICEDKQETKTCRESRKTNAGKACCDTPYLNNWDEKTQTCTCGAGEKFEIYDTNHGRCVSKGDGVTPVEPTPSPESYTCLDNIAKDINVNEHVNCLDAKKAYEDVYAYCTDCTTDKCAGYSAMLGKYKSALTACQSSSGALSIEIERLRGEIAGKIAGWKDTLSVWKDKQGNFNTARLASDSIAGVVLGTAGGLITSHVVKKSQVKSGFEDINCVIGGQKVADWHDEFTVGIK